MNVHQQRVFDVVRGHYAQTVLMALVVIMDQDVLFGELQYAHDFLNVEEQCIESIYHQLGLIQGLAIFHLIEEPEQKIQINN
jgi:hypothetical protein